MNTYYVNSNNGLQYSRYDGTIRIIYSVNYLVNSVSYKLSFSVLLGEFLEVGFIASG